MELINAKEACEKAVERSKELEAYYEAQRRIRVDEWKRTLDLVYINDSITKAIRKGKCEGFTLIMPDTFEADPASGFVLGFPPRTMEMVEYSDAVIEVLQEAGYDADFYGLKVVKTAIFGDWKYELMFTVRMCLVEEEDNGTNECKGCS